MSKHDNNFFRGGAQANRPAPPVVNAGQPASALVAPAPVPAAGAAPGAPTGAPPTAGPPTPKTWRVRAVHETGFRRAGFAFAHGRDTVVDPAQLTAKQVADLELAAQLKVIVIWR